MPRKQPAHDTLFPTESRLFYGDNLRILRNHKYVAEESVDLVYLDPPFKPTESYNVLFRTRDGKVPAAAQVRAFEDTWRWDEAAAEALHDTIENAPERVGRHLKALHVILGDSDMFAYMCMMAPRLVELRKAMRETGSIYLHCDHAAGSYLRVLMDTVFGPENCRAIITWKRTYAHGNVGRNYGAVTDSLLFYTKGPTYTWNQPYTPMTPAYIKKRFSATDADGRHWQSVTLRNPSLRPNLRYDYTASNGVTYQPHPNGWAVDLERMKLYDLEGRLHFPAKPSGQLRVKQYLDETPGMKLSNLWDDVYPINSQAAERLGYPTQKPESLLERIVRVSSNQGDMVLDPFCGCGTSIAVAQREGRMWIGIDITEAAIRIIRERLEKEYGPDVGDLYTVWGEPESLEDAETLAREDPYQFQWWAVRQLGAREVERRKGADKGVDGRLLLRTWDAAGDRFPEAIISVKAGRTGPTHVRDLRGTMEREGAEIGVFVTLKEPTPAMRSEAASAGLCPGGRPIPKLQLITAADIINGKQVEYPVGVGAVERVSSRRVASGGARAR